MQILCCVVLYEIDNAENVIYFTEEENMGKIKDTTKKTIQIIKIDIATSNTF